MYTEVVRKAYIIMMHVYSDEACKIWNKDIHAL